MWVFLRKSSVFVPPQSKHIVGVASKKQFIRKLEWERMMKEEKETAQK